MVCDKYIVNSVESFIVWTFSACLYCTYLLFQACAHEYKFYLKHERILNKHKPKVVESPSEKPSFTP